MAVLDETTLREMYYRQLQQLLPMGDIWARDDDAELSKLLKGLAYEFARIHLRSYDLLDEFAPDTASELLTEWETSRGLPGNCTTPSTDDERRLVLTSKVIGSGAPTAAMFVAMALELGFDSYAKHLGEFPSFKTGLSKVGDPLQSDEWAYYWELVLTNPDYENETRVQCLIDEVMPAHVVGKALVPYDLWATGAAIADSRAIAVGDGRIVAIDGNTSRVSTDAGASWSSHTLTTAGADALYAMWDPVNGLFVAIGWDGAAPFINTSPDGESWTTRASPHGSSFYYGAAHDSAGNICIVGPAGIATSADGFTWVSRASVTPGLPWTVAHDYLGQWVIGGSTNIQYSADSYTWTAATTTPSNDVRTVLWNGSKWLAAGDSGYIYSSTDGDNWASFALAGINQIWHILRVPDYDHYLLIHNGSERMMRSRDTVTWYDAKPDPAMGGLSQLAYLPRHQGGPMIAGVGDGTVFWKSNLR